MQRHPSHPHQSGTLALWSVKPSRFPVRAACLSSRFEAGQEERVIEAYEGKRWPSGALASGKG